MPGTRCRQFTRCTPWSFRQARACRCQAVPGPSPPELHDVLSGSHPHPRGNVVYTALAADDDGQAYQKMKVSKSPKSERLAAAATAEETKSIKERLTSTVQSVKEKLFFQTPLPIVGSARLSYARFLHLLHNRMIKRMTLLADGQVALIEVPIHQGGHDYETQRYLSDDLSALYLRELPEWRMEVLRYYVELPGDFWYNADLWQAVHTFLPHRTGDGYTNSEWVTEAGQYKLDVRVMPPGEGVQWIAAYSSQIMLILGLVTFRLALGGLEAVLSRLGALRGTKGGEKARMLEEMSRSIATAYNVGGAGKRSTGVAFADVQGIDAVKEDVLEIVEMLLGSERYTSMGAKVPRGILLEGPPGTGKTYLARAMANEAGVPFFSANGAEFVQMFQGVAAARVRSLFDDARKAAPAIIFIDEIDALGKARNPDGYKDPGTAEREQGLLQLLVEMDGFRSADRVLVIGATNRRTVLDAALMRPGRFDRTIHMGTPSQENRYRILKVHVRGKQVPRGNDDALLRAVAARAVGSTGAELANMLNEAAILQVRYAKPEIDMEIFEEVIEKSRTGLPSPPLPPTAAKRHLALIWAARAVGSACDPHSILGRVESVTIRPVGPTLGRVLHEPHQTWREARARLGDFGACVQLLTPLYVARAVEEVLLGPAHSTLSTAPDIACAGRLARWLVAESRLHPGMPASGPTPDLLEPLTQYSPRGPVVELVLRLQVHAYQSALRVAHARRAAIAALADELADSRTSTVAGARVYELLKDAPPAEVEDAVLAALPFSDLMRPEAASDFMVAEKSLARAVGLVKGDVDPGVFFDADTLRHISSLFADEPTEWLERRRALEAFASREEAPFPPKPDLREKVVRA